MNPLKKPIGGLLANPFGGKDKQEINPLSQRALDGKRHSKTNFDPIQFPSYENPSIANPLGSHHKNPRSPNESQLNPSRMIMNPLRVNVVTSDDKRRGSGLIKQSSMDIGGFMKAIPRQGPFKSDNPYENFKHIIYEIERKDAKIQNLDSEVRNVKLASDPKETESYRRHLNEAVKTFHAEEHRNNALADKNAKMKEEIETMKAEILKTQPIVQRQQNFFKSNNQLQNEFNGLQSQLGELRGRYGNIVVNDKIKIEKEFKQKMESQLFQITLDIAKDNKNAEIQKLCAKLRGKKLAVSNLM